MNPFTALKNVSPFHLTFYFIFHLSYQPFTSLYFAFHIYNSLPFPSLHFFTFYHLHFPSTLFLGSFIPLRLYVIFLWDPSEWHSLVSLVLRVDVFPGNLPSKILYAFFITCFTPTCAACRRVLEFTVQSSKSRNVLFNS